MSDKPKKIVVKLPAKETTPTSAGPPKVVFKKDPFKPAGETPRRVKAYFYGGTGVRKTRTALSFPKPAVIDLEAGTDWYKDEYEFVVLPCTTFDEISGAVDWLATNEHPYLTLVVDPSTVLWELLQKKWSDIYMVRKRGSKGYKFDFFEMSPLDWKPIKAEMKDLIRRLHALDMHVLFTAREKDLYADGEMMRKIGITHDGEKNFPYAFDVVLRMWKDEKENTVGLCTKDRTGKLPTEEWKVSYDAFVSAFGKEYLERKMVLAPPPPPSEEPKEKVLVVEASTVETAELEEEYWECKDCGVRVEKRGSTGWTCTCGKQFGTAGEPGVLVHDVLKKEKELGPAEDPPTEATHVVSGAAKVVIPNADKATKIAVKLPAEKPDIGGNPKGGDPNEIRAAQEKKAKEAKKGSSSNPIKVTIKKTKPSKEKEDPPEEFCTEKQEKDIREFCEVLGYNEKKMMQGLAAHDATSFSTLKKHDAETIIEILERQVKDKR